MANPANVLAAYKKIGLRVALVGEINASTSTTMEHELLNTNFDDTWPDPNNSVEEWGLPSAGSPLNTSNNFTLGRAEPDFNVELPVTRNALAIALGSLTQDETYVGSPDYSFSFIPNSNLTGVPASKYMNCEAGMASSAASVFKVQGALVKTLKITAPPVGPDLGKVMMSWGVIAANSTPANAFTAGTPTIDPGTLTLSSNYVMSIDGSSVKHVSFEINMDNNASKGLNAGATPDYMMLGNFVATGTATVLLTSSANDEYDALTDAYRAKTVKELLWSVGSGHYFRFDAVITAAPKMSKQGGVFTASFQWKAVNVDGVNPAFGVNSNVSDGDFLAWTT